MAKGVVLVCCLAAVLCWFIALGSIAAITDDCRVALGASECAKMYKLEWWAIWFQFGLTLITIFLALSGNKGASPTLQAFYAALLSLTMLFANQYLPGAGVSVSGYGAGGWNSDNDNGNGFGAGGSKSEEEAIADALAAAGATGSAADAAAAAEALAAALAAAGLTGTTQAAGGSSDSQAAIDATAAGFVLLSICNFAIVIALGMWWAGSSVALPKVMPEKKSEKKKDKDAPATAADKDVAGDVEEVRPSLADGKPGNRDDARTGDENA